MQVDEKGLEAVAAFLKERDDALMPGEADDAERLESAQAAITTYLSARSAEPVAWMWTHEDGTRSFVADEDTKRIWTDTMKRKLAPLYLAHPTPEASDA